MSTAFLQRLAQDEPWRLGRGLPKNALDPTWIPSQLDAPCTATEEDINWEAGTEWWTCLKCGYVGSAYYLNHKPIQHPVTFFLDSLLSFCQQAKTPSPETLVYQGLFIIGVALRYAAAQPPGKLGEFAERMVTR